MNGIEAQSATSKSISRFYIDLMLFQANQAGKLEERIQALASAENSEHLLCIVKNQYPQYLDLCEKVLLLV
jgi:hypothetical protein